MLALVVEDNDDLAFVWCETLRRWGFTTTHVQSCKEAFSILLTEHYDIALLDLFVRDGTTVAVCDLIKMRTPNTKVIAITGSTVCPHGEHAEVLSADYFLRKPTPPYELGAIASFLTSRPTEPRCIPTLA